MKKRILSIVLTLAMVLSLFPAAIFAESSDAGTGGEESHVHGAPKDVVTFQWADDYATCVAQYVCSGCNETLTEDCDVIADIIKQPSVEEEGEIRYTAGIGIGSNGYYEVCVVALPKLPAPDTAEGVANFAELKAALEKGGDIKLTADIVAEGTLTVPAGVTATLDLNGKKITGKDNKTDNKSTTTDNFYLFDIVDGVLTVKDTVGTGEVTLIAVNNRAWNSMSAIFHNHGGELVVESGVYKHLGGTDMAFVVDNSASYHGDAKLTVIGGTLQSTYTAIRLYMSNSSACGSSIADIKGGYIYGGSRAVWGQVPSSSAGHKAALTVSGGTLAAPLDTGAAINIQRSAYGDVDVLICGEAVIDGPIYAEAQELQITSGTFTGNLYLRDESNIAVESAEIISGGKFTTNVSDYLVAGTRLKGEDSDDVGGYVTYARGSKVVIGNVGYGYSEENKDTALTDAIAAVKDGETIVILPGTLSEGTIKLPAALKNVTIKGEDDAILKDMAITAADGNSISYDGLTFDGITFENSRISITGWRTNGAEVKNLTVTNCVFQNLDDTTNSAPVHINIDATEAVENFTFTKNVIDGATGGSKSGVYAQVTGEIVFSGNTINNVAFRPYVIQVTTNDGIEDIFVVYNNTFSGSAVGRAQALGNNAEGTDKVALGVCYNIFKGITDSQQICYWNFNPATTTADLHGNYYDIDIEANPSKIYYNSAAQSVEDLVDMGIYPFYADEAKTELVEPPYVAQIGEEKFLTLAAAIAAAQDGDTIELLADVALNGKIESSGKKITVNGNDHWVTGSGYLRFVDGDYTIKNLKFDGQQKVLNEGTWGMIEAVSTKLQVIDCLFHGLSGNSCIAVDCDAVTGDGDSEVVIEGCTFQNNNNNIAVLYLQEGKAITVENCVFNWNNAPKETSAGIVYIADVHELNMTGNSFFCSWVGNVKDNKAVILAGPYTAAEEGYAININENAFLGDDNCVAVCVEGNGVDTVYNLDNNYWGGAKTNYTTYYKEEAPVVYLDDWYEDEALTKLHIHGATVSDIVFDWADDYSSCVAEYVCECGGTFTVDAAVTAETKQPTVEEEGYVKYQASVKIAGVTYTDVQTVVLAKVAVITVDTKDAAAGKEVTLDVSISGNPGFGGFSFGLEYDSAVLTPKSATKGAVLNDDEILFSAGFEKNIVSAVYYKDITGNGVLFSVTFAVAADAEGKLPVSVTVDGMVDAESKDVANTVVAGAVNVLKGVVTEIPDTDDESDTKIAVDHTAEVEETKKEDVKVENVVVPEDSDMTPEQAEQAAKELHEAVTEIKVEAEQIAAEQAANVTVEEITEAVKEIEKQLEADETVTETKVTNVTVETKVSLEVKVEEAVLAPVQPETEQNETVSTLTVNITPVVTTTITGETDNGDTKTVTVKENAKAEVKIPVTVTIPLPAGYFKVGDHLTVIHTKSTTGEKFYHDVVVEGTPEAPYVEFMNENGFSKFIIVPKSTNFAVHFEDTKGADITEAVKVIGVNGVMDVTDGLPAGKYAVIGVNGGLCKPVVFDVTANDTVKVVAAPVFETELGNLPAMIAVYYDALYEIAYAYADTLGYVDVAVDGLEIALDSLDVAYKFVEGYELPAELDDVKAEMLNELVNTKNTLSAVMALLQGNPDDVDKLIAAVLSLEDDLWAHLETLKALALEAGIVIDPYLIQLNDAVVKYGKLVDATIIDTYNMIVETYNEAVDTVEGFVDAYAAWVETVGAAVDVVNPELGDAVRKFLTEVPADSLAILAAYGEEAIYELFDVAADTAADVADAIADLAGVLYEHGEEIYNAVKENDEVEALVKAIKVQLAKAEKLAKEIAQLKTGDVLAAAKLAKKEAALQAVYDELTIHYNKLSALVISVVDDVDEEAACALADALDALTEALCITCESAEGYLGWLADHAEAMGGALLAALLDNIDELLTTACPIIDQMIWDLIAQIEAAIPGIIEYLIDELIAFLPIADQWMYDWLYNHPYEVIAFFTEYGDELAALADKYGDEIVGILGYIAYTYGPEVLEFIIENPCEALDMFMQWYNKYGYRIWPMIDVYLEALGVYDAIEDAVNGELDKLNDLLNQIEAEILEQIAALQAQIEALKEALKDAEGALREQILAEIAALEEAVEQLYKDLMAALKSFLQANISANYVVGPNSYYVALGDAGAYGPAADLLAAELGMTNKYANLTIENATASDVLAALNADEIAKADLITLGFGANPIIDAVITDVTNAAFGEVSEKDWAALVGEEGAAAIAAALVELGEYVMEQTGEEMLAALLPLAVESLAYVYINHLVDYVVVSEAIHEINAEALLVLVGMHNPLDGVVFELGEEKLDLGEYVDYLVTLSNIYSFGYALFAENTIYVDAPDVEIDAETMLPTEAGYVYIQEQIYNALNPTLYEEEEHVHSGTVIFTWAPDNSTCKAAYVCSVCGLTETRDCLVEVEITKQPTVEEAGEAKYTASVEFFGTTYSETKTVELPKLPAPETGDTAMIGLYVTMMLVASVAAVVVLKKKKNA